MLVAAADAIGCRVFINMYSKYIEYIFIYVFMYMYVLFWNSAAAAATTTIVCPQFCGLFAIAYGAFHDMVDAGLRIAWHQHMDKLLHKQIAHTWTRTFGQLEY